MLIYGMFTRMYITQHFIPAILYCSLPATAYDYSRASCPGTVVLYLLLYVIYDLVFSWKKINNWMSPHEKERKKNNNKNAQMWLQYNKNEAFVLSAADIYQPICGCVSFLCVIQNIICHFVNTFQPKSLPASVSVWRINALHSSCLHFSGFAWAHDYGF